MPAVVSGKKRITESSMCFSTPDEQDKLSCSKSNLTPQVAFDHDSPLLPGLPDDVAKCILALVPRSNFPAMGAVCKKWRRFIQSKEFITVRKLLGLLEEWLCILTMDPEGKQSQWQVLDCLGNQHRLLPPMPGPVRAGFGVVVNNGKLIVMAGYSVSQGTGSASADVYQYDSCLNSWSKLANMTVSRFDFACAEVNGNVYAVGGYGSDGESLSSAEVYDPDTDKWTLIESLRRPRWVVSRAALMESFMLWVGGQASQLETQNSLMCTILRGTLGVR